MTAIWIISENNTTFLSNNYQQSASYYHFHKPNLAQSKNILCLKWTASDFPQNTIP